MNDAARFWELSNELFAVANFEGRFTHANPACEQTLGWGSEELCSRPFLDFVHPDDRE